MLFRSVSVQHFEEKGLFDGSIKIVNLKYVVGLVDSGQKQNPLGYPEELEHRGEAIYWANEDGGLQREISVSS